MAHSAIEFEWYDAWILAAVIYATEGNEPVPLWRLISIADAMNKDIVFRQELEVALDRLSRTGYVRVVPDGFEATRKALALKAPGPPIDNVARALGAKPWSENTPLPSTCEERYVSADAYAKALRKYRKEFAKRSRQQDA